MRRRITRLMVGPAALAAVFIGVAPIMIAPAASAAMLAYGPTAPTLALGSTVATLGGSITLTASGCKFPEHFVITIHSVTEVIGSANSQSNGDFTATVVIPTNIGAGTHTIVATGNKGDVISAAVVVEAAATGTAVASTSGSSSGLAFTGTDAVASAGFGAGAIALGGLLVLGSRRRRRSAWKA